LSSLRVFLPIAAFALLLTASCAGTGPMGPERGLETAVGASLTAQAVKAVVRNLEQDNRIVPGELDLKLADGQEIDPIVEQWDLNLINYSEAIGFYHFALPAGADLGNTIAEMRSDPRISVAEPVYVTHMNALRVEPNDPRFLAGEQWYMENMDVPEAWVIEPGDPAVVPAPAVSDVAVAVLDTGIDYQHPDLKPTAPGPLDEKILPGFDFVNGDAIPQDDNGHGTMICGIVGARTGNALGIASVGWNARIIPVKVLDIQGKGTSIRTADGIMFAMQSFLEAKNKLDPFDNESTLFANPFNARLIINMSYTYVTPNSIGPSQMELAAVKYAIDHGALLVAAAGDGARPLDDGSTSVYPASYTGVIAVGATDQANALSPDSNTLPAYANPATANFFVAPGVDMVSTNLTTISQGYGVGSGTSFSAACLSGVAALIWSQFPFLEPHEVIETLAVGADSNIVGSLGADLVSGHGLINALDSLQRSFTPDPTNDPIIVRAFTNPILHGDVIFVIRSHYKLLTAVEVAPPSDPGDPGSPLINDGLPFKYLIGWDYDLNGTVDQPFPYVNQLLDKSYWRHEIYFGQVDTATYIGRVHFPQDLTYVLTPDPYAMGQMVIEFTGVPADRKVDATLPQTITASTSIQIDEFNYDLPS
jgi:subtilisin family serine protease